MPLTKKTQLNLTTFNLINILPVLAFILRIFSLSAIDLSYILISLYALFGKKETIQALALSWFFTMINPGLTSGASTSSTGRYIVILAALISIVLRCKKATKINKVHWLTFIFGITLITHSILFSHAIDVSILKVTAWITVVLTLLSAWQALQPDEKQKLFKQLQNFLILILLLSLPLLAIPQIGYRVNETGFQGVLNHPQAFGPTVALTGSMIGGRIIGERNPSWYNILLLVLCFALIILSEARTAGLSLILGLIISITFSPKIAGISSNLMLPGLRSRRLQAITVVAASILLTTAPIFTENISAFIFKRSDTSTLLDAADASRGHLVEKMISNIEMHPLTGIGFGIASIPSEMEIERDPIFNLPLGAPIEKGVMPIALIEELGIFGATIGVMWIMLIIRKGATAGATQFAAVITLLLVNMGEFMFFSAGGMGMLLLIILTGAITGERIKNRAST